MTLKRPSFFLAGLLCLLMGSGLALAAAGQSRPGGQPADDYLVSFVPVADGFYQPVGIFNAGDGRLFVIERQGIIWIIDQNGSRLPQPFLDIHHKVDDAFWEQGLLGLVFHPNYAQNGYFYLNYNDLNGNTNIARFRVSAGDPNVADPASEQLLLLVNQPTDTHNAGDLHFGPDGYLYFGLGDGGGIGSLGNAQDGQTLLGKMMRLDVDSAFPYAIPPDNPFVGNSAVRDEIWLLGLRNPWRFSFDRLAGELYIGNVGGVNFEEVEYLPAGAAGGNNFGWPCYEGTSPYRPEYCAPGTQFTFPITGYANPAEGCAMIGGFVYRGTQFPLMAGDYLFSDACKGSLWRARPGGGGTWQRRVVNAGYLGLSSLGEGADGELYAAGLHDGVVYHLVPTTPGHIFLPALTVPAGFDALPGAGYNALNYTGEQQRRR